MGNAFATCNAGTETSTPSTHTERPTTPAPRRTTRQTKTGTRNSKEERRTRHTHDQGPTTPCQRDANGTGEGLARKSKTDTRTTNISSASSKTGGRSYYRSYGDSQTYSRRRGSKSKASQAETNSTWTRASSIGKVWLGKEYLARALAESERLRGAARLPEFKNWNQSGDPLHANGPHRSDPLHANRSQGNALFCQAFDVKNGRSPALRIRDAREAMSLFRAAQADASTAPDWLKATKNLAITQVKLAALPGFQERASLEEVVGMIREGLVNLLACVLSGYKHGQDLEWIRDLDERANSAARSLQEYLVRKTDNWRLRCGQFEKVLSDSRLELQPSKRLVGMLWMFAAEEMAKEWIRLDEANNWCGALSMMHEIHRPLSELQTRLARPPLAKQEDLKQKLAEVQSTFNMQRAKSQCAQQTFLGMDLLQSVLYEEEDFDYNLLWTAIDHLKAAVQATRNEEGDTVDLEGEAKALALLGDVYLKALKLNEKAHEIILQSIQIAESIMQDTGKSFYGEDWYQVARDNLTKLRREKEEKDRQKQESDVAGIKAKIKPQLDAIVKAMSESEAKVFQTRNLLRHVYKHHPPKTQGASFKEDQFDSDDKAGIRKFVKQAVAHYHPDKSVNKKHGDEWTVLCGEITKHLNTCFMWYK